MSENDLMEAAANLILKTISVWEDIHLYALTHSTEYNTFWGLLDDSVTSRVCLYRQRNRAERRVPFTLSHFDNYDIILSRVSLETLGGQFWKKQLKLIFADEKCRAVMSRLNTALRRGKQGDDRDHKYHASVTAGNQQFATRIG